MDLDHLEKRISENSQDEAPIFQALALVEIARALQTTNENLKGIKEDLHQLAKKARHPSP